MILWLSFFLCCVLTLTNLYNNPSTIPFNAIDEQGHMSYALHLITHHRWWPNFLHFNLFDVASHAELPTLNYINHPPIFYWLMKLAAMALPALEPIHFRVVALVIYLTGLVLYTRLGVAMSMSIAASILYGLTPLLVYLHLQMGFYNNDAVCFLGGMVATLASLHWLRGEHPRRAILWMGLGVILASVKLTALLLVGFYVAATILQRRSTLRSLPKHFILYGIITVILCTAPYLYMTLTFGSPAPTTPGQLAKLVECANCATQGLAPQSNFLPWLSFFLAQLANQLSVPETTFIPICVYLAALLVIAWQNRHNPRSWQNQPLVAMALASAAATLLTLSIHCAFAWHRYVEYGWIFDSLVRYYLPLLGAYAAVSGYAIAYAAHEPKEKP